MNEVVRRKVLEAPLVGFSRGRQIEQKYRAVLLTYADGNKGIGVEEWYPRSERWGGVPSGWYLDTLLGLDRFSRGPIGDEIALDAGQEWTVRGMIGVLNEAIEKEVF